MISGRAAFTHFNILYCSGTEDQFSSAQEFATRGFCWSHSCHIGKTGPHFILSLHYNLNLFTYKIRQEKKFFSSNPTMGTFTCNKDALGKAAAFTSGAYIKFSVLVSNRNNNVRSYNASTFQWALDYYIKKKKNQSQRNKKKSKTFHHFSSV